MTATSLSQIYQTIKTSNSIVILTHMKPDGDTLGSSIALCRYLRYLGKEASIYQRDPIPSNLSFLDTSHMVQVASSDVDLIIAIDSSDPGRLDSRLGEFNATLINIDHHQTNTLYGDHNYVFATGSTGEIIYQMLKEWGAPFDQETMDALYTAIATDTNRFYYRSTSAETHRAVADLIDQGLEPIKLNTLIYGQIPLEKKKLQAYALQSAQIQSDDQMIISEISRKTQALYGTNDTDDIVEMLRDIAGIEVAVLSYQTAEDWRLSLRSKQKIDVGSIALEFGGGGHYGAAGIAVANNDYPSVLHRVIEQIEAKLVKR